ncbi:MAG: endonuclease domain-containing protein [Bacteroidetes bacterium]|nr:endonuclease domain-containing protein [Bacteroidota bacterium]MCL5737553.1 endonuclease domain-containing protein [Bacteroidota bacterium]
MIFNRKNLKHRRKFLRNNMTSAEILLWSRLKNSQLGGLKFRRQESINEYIVDFYCPARKLTIEIDGDVHGYDSRISADLKRQKEIEEIGIKVIRYTNSDVKENLDGVLQNILQEAISDSNEPPLSPLLCKEGKEGQTQTGTYC